MSRLQTLKPRLAMQDTQRVKGDSVAERRITGRRLQSRRLRVWTKDPHCQGCGRLVDFPYGFELDHKVPLHAGGPDTEDNCQVLCSGPDGCHAAKTVGDVAGLAR